MLNECLTIFGSFCIADAGNAAEIPMVRGLSSAISSRLTLLNTIYAGTWFFWASSLRRVFRLASSESSASESAVRAAVFAGSTALGLGFLRGGGALLHGNLLTVEKHRRSLGCQGDDRELIAGFGQVALLLQCIQVKAHALRWHIPHDAIGRELVQPALQGFLILAPRSICTSATTPARRANAFECAPHRKGSSVLRW